MRGLLIGGMPTACLTPRYVYEFRLSYTLLKPQLVNKVLSTLLMLPLTKSILLLSSKPDYPLDKDRNPWLFSPKLIPSPKSKKPNIATPNPNSKLIIKNSKDSLCSPQMYAILSKLHLHCQKRRYWVAAF